ncbi:tRNA 2-selenouridine(34) synthase MnmH [Bordetella bronchiseptica]|uniref:tRNA 2-selenouridine(34) synthase MnmH n=1 Tax=Bordetella bronchiseptica TaxID=518 RepID=UPI00028FBA08|nr:tRNA 2-selenouridine(34) synthase MnmH [Bordetella bronchiseptica]KCV26958.1 tRNA 2-selenouridine synthase [Bordetella bronchiseptica 00-P-2730]AWQ07657.1 tRNA 2-selenouridine(34) synthase MnmH [Bordetella bronchiseptica]KCV56251.1 tRNA 2-selenouridine synthase [Bordetella bronchiseptica 7E71]KDC16812.1 tRNA 2-selenouridine synthase [Bordetella bronchiseptica F-1]KDC29364.1 tRNA 2-selenouridine synthase [Bordetella bronchiseptica F2]
MRADTRDFRALFLGDAPLLDTRAPVEFAKGAFPGAVNLPLMSDAERHRVGLCYKQQGQDAAIALGHRLVSGAVKAERVAAWAAFAQAHPEGYLYCFRGGLRSQISQAWLREEAGIAYPRVIGGYKAMRGFLLETIEQAIAECGFVVLGGMTGTGKTDVLRQLDHGLDLEAHAHHRGSSFGKHATGQPAQIDFDNRLAIDILKKRAAGCRQFVVEDESQAIGSCSLPFGLYQGMQRYPVVWLEDTQPGRVQRILRDYVIDLCGEFIALHGEQDGFGLYAARLRQSLDNIARRLGGERHRRLAALMDEALARQAGDGSVDAHRAWIEPLLTEYYDPMYAYQRQAKAARIVFTGDHREVLDYLRGPGRALP